ncbi:hypothetical protein RIEGSTA812A_PEG_1163 [invertebrate metagenome]|uniref:Uncharacterized protein n=1 Tax=invertebrate metagenome TaxID=1711999 RepID=A0A484H7T4_9ZZZZ
MQQEFCSITLYSSIIHGVPPHNHRAKRLTTNHSAGYILAKSAQQVNAMGRERSAAGEPLMDMR